MPTRIVTLALAVVLLAVLAPAWAHAKEPGVIESDGVIVDNDYRMRLQTSGTGWRPMNEKTIKQLVPDAVIGASMYKPPHGHGAVIVEPAAKQDLGWATDFVVGNMPLEDKQVVRKVAKTYNGVPAMDVLVVGKADGVRVRYRMHVVIRGAYLFQCLAWGLEPHTKADGSDFQPFFDALTFTKGPIRVREFVPTIPDMTRTGWEVRDGVFRSAVSGLQVVPQEGWRLIVGDELLRMNDSAEVGLATTGELQVFAVILTERVAGLSDDAIKRQLAFGLTEMPSPPLVLSLAGGPVAITQYKNADTPFVYRTGLFRHGDRADRLLAWHATGEPAAASAALTRAAAGITRLSDPERAALRTRLVAAPETQNAVGPGFAVRSRTFMDFKNEVRWTAPEGIWKLTTGQGARAFAEEATLLIEEPSLGVFGMLRHDPAGMFDEAGYHQAVLETLWGAPDAKTALATSKELPLAGRPALRIAIANRTVNGQRFTHVVATGVHNGRGSRLLLWGWPGNMAASKAQVGQAIRNLHLAGTPTSSTTKAADSFRDMRLGFAMRAPGPTFRAFKDQTPPALAPIGRIISWKGPDGMAMAMGVCNLGQMEHTQALADRVINNTTGAFPGTPKISASSIGGLPATRRSWAGRADVWVVVRGRTVYLVLYERRPTSRIRAESALAAFELLK